MLIFHMDFNYVGLRHEFVLKLLEKVALLGYDTILWELENQVRWESCPECAAPDSWSKGQFQELLDYSRKLKLEPIPLLQTIGHGEYVMTHQRYHSFREHPDYSDCYCVSNPQVRKFLRNWIGEYCELFGELNYFHLGGDEAYRFGVCRECSGHERNSLYGEHINFLAKDLRAKNIRPGIWGDMILANPDNLDSISSDFIVWDWNYSTGVGIPETVHLWGDGDVTKETVNTEQLRRFPELLASNGELNPFYTSDILKKRGYDVILCSAARSYSDSPFCPNVAIHAPNIARGAANASSEKPKLTPTFDNDSSKRYDKIKDIPSKVSFLKEDRSTSGNWKGSYGKNGYLLPGIGKKAPEQTDIQATGVLVFWERNTADARALQRETGEDRTAARFQEAEVTVEILSENTQPRKITLYLLDWEDNMDPRKNRTTEVMDPRKNRTTEVMDPRKNRTTEVSARNPMTNTPYDVRNVESFHDGVYLTYEVSGSVIFKLYRVKGSTAVISGLFFD